MKKPSRNKKKGFTLLEILIAALILGVTSVLVIPRILQQVEKAKESEAVNNLSAIRSAELLLHNLTGQFAAADDEAGIESALGLSVKGLFYNYKIINADGENFLALAIPLGPISDWLNEFGINKDGFVGYTPGDGSSGRGSGGGSGGSSGGGSGGSSSGGSGGSSGGGSGGGSGSSSSDDSNNQNSSTVTGGGCAVSPPQNLVVTPNDNWLVFSFEPMSGAEGYSVERAEKTGDTVGTWQPLNLGLNCSWEDNVQNGKEYCYQAYTIDTPSGCGQMSSPACSMVCGSAGPNAAYTAAITAGELKLDTAIYADPSDGAPSGAAEVTFLNDPDGDPATDDAIPILFGQLQDNALAYVNPNTGALVLDVDYLTQPTEFLAALLAHEALHLIWNKDWTDYTSGIIPAPLYGNNPNGTIRTEYSYYNEFSAFTTHAMAWQSFFPDTFVGNAAKQALKNTLDATGEILYSNMEAAAIYFLDDSGDRLSFPSGKPSGLLTSSPAYNLNVVEILTTVYGYDLDSDY